MALNAKVQAEIDRQVAAGKMDSGYADTLKKTLDTAPDEFQASFLAGPDYQRNQQALQRERTEFETTKKGWVEWEAKAKPIFEAQTTENASLKAKVADLEAKVAAGGMNMNDENAVLKEINGLKETIKTLTANQFMTPQQVQELVDKKAREAVGFMGDFSSMQRRIDAQHFEVFGKHLTPAQHDELITFSNEHLQKTGRNIGIDEAYKMKFEAEIKDVEKKKWIEEGDRNATARLSAPGSGQGGGGGMPPMDKGPLQIRMEELKGKELAPGDGDLLTAKAAAANALRGIA